MARLGTDGISISLLERRLLELGKDLGRPGLPSEQHVGELQRQILLEQQQTATGQVTQHLHEHGGNHPTIANGGGCFLDGANLHLRHIDHDAATRQLA
jgi:hypothetical protein